MRIVVNGKEMDVKDNITIDGLLKELDILEKTMASAINMKIVKKDDWKTYCIKEGDRVEFLHFVGGG